MNDILSPKSRAHDCLSTFHSICDDYNQGELSRYEDQKGSVSYYRALQTMTLEAYDLIKELHGKEPCEATRAYMIFCGKILLRLNHLVHSQRIETPEEHRLYFREFTTKLDAL